MLQIIFPLSLTGSFQTHFMLSLVCPFLEMTLVPERGKLATPFNFFLSFFLI